MTPTRLCALLLASAACLSACTQAPSSVDAPVAETPAIREPIVLTGKHASGAYWSLETPENWNGTLLLFGRGFSPSPSANPSVAPANVKDLLLSRGYALAASSYSSGGWSVADSPRDQIDVLDVFIEKVGKPKRTIAWGDSMGGITTVAMAEKFGDRIDGALSMCGSVSGAVPMLNTALDGAFAFRTLLAPSSDIRIVNVDDDRANSARVRAVLDQAMTTPQGRARVALSGVLAQIPGWTDPADPQPAATDYAAQLQQIAKAFVMGVYLPRQDQEQRAGGVNSWNTGVDYRAQFAASGRDAMVRALYAEAGLDLDADLAALNAEPRIAADPKAVAYMHTAYSPTGKPGKPLLIVHELGDGMTIANLSAAYAQKASAAGTTDNVAQAWVEQAGHCRFTPAQRIASLQTLEQRLDTGRWSVEPSALNARATAVPDGGAARFVSASLPPLLRACDPKTGVCAGAP